jgi:hypothetical protein
MSQLMAAVLEIFHVKKLNTTSYHPQTNGLTERFNQTLTTMLSHYVNEKQTDWDLYLPYVLFAYRTTPHHSLKESPFYLVFGHDARLPFSTLVSSSPEMEMDQKDETADDYALRLIDKLRTAHFLVQSHWDMADVKRNSLNRLMTAVPSYEIGDKVLIFRPHKAKKGEHTTKKLASHWKGPYEVIERFNNRINYSLHPLTRTGQKVNGARSFMVHVSAMKKYQPEDMSAIRQQTGE